MVMDDEEILCVYLSDYLVKVAAKIMETEWFLKYVFKDDYLYAYLYVFIVCICFLGQPYSCSKQETCVSFFMCLSGKCESLWVMLISHGLFCLLFFRVPTFLS